METKELLLWLFLCLSFGLNIWYVILTYKESYRKSFEDPLTKLNNRKFLEEVEQLVKYGNEKYEVIFCDIDFFKKVNDTYGHNVGDEVLKITGQKLKSNFKSNKDHIIRYGGEEFIILLSSSSNNNEAITHRIENLRKSIEETILQIEDQEIKFTMSFGICFCNSNKSFQDQIKAADEALYFSKKNGRNRVTISKCSFSSEAS
jgi:diguanylate cyclase (GGDEF)-like protein